MGKTKLRKLRVNNVDYGWSVDGPKDTLNNTNQVTIWDVDTLQILDKFSVNEFTVITPAIVVKHIETKL